MAASKSRIPLVCLIICVTGSCPAPKLTVKKRWSLRATCAPLRPFEGQFWIRCFLHRFWNLFFPVPPRSQEFLRFFLAFVRPGLAPRRNVWSVPSWIEWRRLEGSGWCRRGWCMMVGTRRGWGGPDQFVHLDSNIALTLDPRP